MIQPIQHVRFAFGDAARTRRGGMSPGRRPQSGAVLIVALIFLVLLTILALGASGTSFLQQKMVGATRNAQLADWGAESALRGAEWRLWSASATTATRIKCGQTQALSDCYIFDRNNPNQVAETFRHKAGWYTTGGTKYTKLDYSGVQSSGSSPDASPKLAHDPYYIIEDLGPVLPPDNGVLHESGTSGPGGVGYNSPATHLYRITARSTGGTASTVRVVQSIFAAKSN